MQKYRTEPLAAIGLNISLFTSISTFFSFAISRVFVHSVDAILIVARTSTISESSMRDPSTKDSRNSKSSSRSESRFVFYDTSSWSC